MGTAEIEQTRNLKTVALLKEKENISRMILLTNKANSQQTHFGARGKKRV